MKLLPTALFALGLLLTLPVVAAEKPPAKKGSWWPWKKEETKPPASTPKKTAKRTPAKKKTPPKTEKPGTLPPKSQMIVIPAPTDPAMAAGESPRLISSEMSGKDLQFFTTAVEAGRGQAYLVNLLQTRAESAQIKALGEALATTQEEENRQIARLAGIKGWQVPTEPTAEHRKIGAALEKQTGSDFDKAVMDQVIIASQHSVEAYQAAARSGDAEIQSFASQMLPVAEEKLRLAEKMTGAGKAAAKFFRTGTPETGAAAPKPIPPPITQ